MVLVWVYPQGSCKQILATRANYIVHGQGDEQARWPAAQG